MGAGSAKGIQDSRNNDGDGEVDRFSVHSQDSPELISKLHAPPPDDHRQKLLAQISKPSKPAPITRTSLDVDDDDDEADDGLPFNKEAPSSPLKPPPPLPAIPIPPPMPAETEKKEEKKKSLFGFSKWKDDGEAKTNASVHDEEKPKKESTTSKGFHLFNWKKDSKVSVEKDEHLDQEINELQKTFDSLGIVGKSLWDSDKKKDGRTNKSQSADDIRNLEPMRNKMNAKSKAARSNGIRKGSEGVAPTTSGGSRRTFKYSWETEGSTQTAVKEDDHWSYKAVVIDGFDLEKFKKANYEDNLAGSRMNNRIPNAIDDDSPTLSPSHGTRSPLTYDQMEQKLLATIEREFAV